MIYDDYNSACIVQEKELLKDGRILNTVCFYNKYPISEGDIDITENKIYEVCNPYWLSDTFVFCKKHYNDVFLVGEVDLVCYIKVNIHNQIEGIGIDFERRFRQDLNAILKRDDVKQSTNLHAIMFTLIGDEYWLKLLEKEKKNEKDYPISTCRLDDDGV